MGSAKIPLDFVLGEMDSRRDDMAWRFFPDLDEVFAKVCFDGPDAGGLQMIVDGDLLADHRFSLGDGSGVRVAANLQNGIAGIRGRWCPVNLSPGLGDLVFVFLQVEIEMRQRMLLDGARLIAQILEFRQIGAGFGAIGDKAEANLAER